MSDIAGHPITPDHQHFYASTIRRLDVIIDNLHTVVQMVAPHSTAGTDGGVALAAVNAAEQHARMARDYYLARDYDEIRKDKR